jgi:hypothetical protein
MIWLVPGSQQVGSTLPDIVHVLPFDSLAISVDFCPWNTLKRITLPTWKEYPGFASSLRTPPSSDAPLPFSLDISILMLRCSQDRVGQALWLPEFHVAGSPSVHIHH